MKWNHQTIGQIFDDLVTSSGLFRKIRVFELNKDWEEIVGKQIANHSSIVDFTDGTLIIRVDDGMWLNEMKLRENILLERMNSAIGVEAIKRIRFRIGR
ncbi:DUF721 domain-containing protein [Mesotoga sp.]|jgi:predicted nucleic acid-binding Zn ribbon protein|uniref:DUF721 domain-containing protein n=1 Tax=Mesotoga infera TaxID=1236046 RepID=A0A117M924_9BACT|nr:MAG: Uncharacterized protein XD86_0715 [Mesotoga infera]KUK91119.1 MAG: Uncharacterized protein XE02_0221 [Mesotoga infera]HCO70125.1 DUF721 domain-containing protein [Mesotoga infera]